MLIPYILLVGIAGVLAVAALFSTMFGSRPAHVSALLGAWASLLASVAIMVYAIFAASATHGGASETFTYSLMAVATLLALVSPAPAVRSFAKSD